MNKPLYLKDLQALLKRGQVSPALVLAGGSEEDRRESVARIRSLVVTPGLEAFNSVLCGAGEMSAEEIISSARTKAMGAGRRMVVVSEPRALSRSGAELLRSYIEEPEAENCLVVLEDEFDQRRPTALMKTALDRGCLYDLRRPEWDREKSVRELLARSKLSADSRTVARLLELLPQDYGRMKRELEKISLSIGERNSFSVNDLENLILDRRGGNWRNLREHLAAGRLPEAVRVLDCLLEEGEEAVALLGYLAETFRQASAARPPAGGQKQPAKNRQTLLPRDRESTAETARRLAAARSVDLWLKSSSLPPALLLEALVGGYISPRSKN